MDQGGNLRLRPILLLLIVTLSFFLPVLASDTPDYVLGPGDEICIEVFDSTNTEILLLYKENVTGYKPYDMNNPLAGNRFIIPFNGIVDIPCLGKFKTTGKKIKDLEKEITSAAKIFDKRPKTVISILSVKTINVYVMGTVKSPGLLTIRDNGYENNILSIISKAGGYYSNSSTSSIIIENENKREILQLRDGEKTNYQVKNNTYIYVPDKREMVYVIGETRYPSGEVPYYKNLNLTEYLASRGGLASSAADEIYLINDQRDMSKNTKVKLKDKLLVASADGEMLIRPGTIIYVPKNIFASWSEVFSNLVLIRETINYPKTFEETTTYYIK